VTTRGNLAAAYHSAGRLTSAIPLYERTVADCERVLGPHHEDTLTSRCNLAHAYYTARRQAEAVAVFERTLADCERVLAPDHPLTKTVRESLQAATQELPAALAGQEPAGAAPASRGNPRRAAPHRARTAGLALRGCVTRA
jgi:Tetratricopeptide repeat